MTTDLEALLARLQRIETSGWPIEAVMDRLCILAVADGHKPAAMVYVGERDPKSCPTHAADAVSKAALDSGLIATTVYLNNDPWVRRPDVPERLLRVIEELWRVKSGRRTLWIARRASDIPRRLRRSTDSTTGAYLGYPRCCDADYLENYVRRAERFYTVACKRCPHRSEHALMEWIRSDAVTSDEDAVWIMFAGADPLATQRSFPFVPHEACPSCLTGKSDATSKQNQYLRDLAKRMSLEDEILQAIHDILEVDEPRAGHVRSVREE